MDPPNVHDGLSDELAPSLELVDVTDDEMESMRKSRGFDWTPFTNDSAWAKSPVTETETGMTEKFSAVMLPSVFVVGAAAVGAAVGVAGVAVGLAVAVGADEGCVSVGGEYATASLSEIVATLTPAVSAVVLSCVMNADVAPDAGTEARRAANSERILGSDFACSRRRAISDRVVWLVELTDWASASAVAVLLS